MLKRFLAVFFVTATLGVAAFAQQPTASPANPTSPAPAALVPPKTHLKVGQPAPDFNLRDTEGKEVNLHDYKGKQNVVLAFYVLAFTGG